MCVQASLISASVGIDVGKCQGWGMCKLFQGRPRSNACQAYWAAGLLFSPRNDMRFVKGYMRLDAFQKIKIIKQNLISVRRYGFKQGEKAVNCF